MNVLHGRHKCGSDVYQATYKINKEDKFSLKYGIVGPQKWYVIETEFTKINNHCVLNSLDRYRNMVAQL